MREVDRKEAKELSQGKSEEKMTWCKVCRKHHAPVQVNKASTTIHSFRPPKKGVPFVNRVQIILPRGKNGQVIEGEKKVVRVADMLRKQKVVES